MIIKHEYKTASEREDILLQNSSLYLIEEQNITEGNFLIFTDVLPIENQIQELKGQIDSLNIAMAEILGGAV